MNHSHNWRNLFVGREALLAQLQEEFRLVRLGPARLCVLVGPSGAGKTRLSQELYRWLSVEYDRGTEEAPQGYWPDAFSTDDQRDRVNPWFDPRESRPRCDIPWLWWGISCPEPPSTTGGDSLRDSGIRIGEGEQLRLAIPELTPHTIQALVTRGIRQIHGDWLWKLLSTGVGFIPVVGSLPGWARDAYDAWRNVEQQDELQRQQAEPVASTADRQRTDQADLARSALEEFLDSRDTDAPNIPVVLFVDDAHWADRTIFNFLTDLWRTARNRNWPLLIVATHWDDEWEQREAHPAPEDNSPRSLADFLQILQPHEQAGTSVIHIPPVDAQSLVAWVRAALPGLTEEQVDLLLDRAAAWINEDNARRQGANLKLLEQMILDLAEEPENFIDEDTAGPLTAAACDWLREQQFDLHSVMRRRFNRLERSVRKALGWSSLQGRRFLASVTSEAARIVAADHESFLQSDEVAPALQQANSPCCWIHPLSDLTEPGRFNLCEFRQAAFHEIAAQHFTRRPEERAAVDQAVTAVLRDWLRSGRLDVPPAAHSKTAERDDALGREECRNALRMAAHRLAPHAADGTASDEHWQNWGLALTALTMLDRGDFLWDEAEHTAVLWAESRPEGWPLRFMPATWQFALIYLLIDMQENGLARRAAEPLRQQLQSQTLEMTQPQNLRRYSACHDLLGWAQLRDGDSDAARQTFIEQLKLNRDLLALVGESPESLRDLSISLDRVGDVLQAQGEAAKAAEHYRESLAICRQIRDRWGESLEGLRDLSVSLERVGDVLLAQGEAAEALEHFWESLAILRQIADRWGESAQSLRDLSVLLRG